MWRFIYIFEHQKVAAKSDFCYRRYLKEPGYGD